MSGYVRQVDITVQFDGRDVHLVMKPLLRKDMLELQALLPSKEDAESVRASTPAFAFYADRLPQYVVSHDVKDAAGSSVPTEEWIGASYFMELVGEIMVQHMEKASVARPLTSGAQQAAPTS